MSKQALVVIAPGCEELEAVTSIDVLVRGGIKVTVASVCLDGQLQIRASRGVQLLADCPLRDVAEQPFDLILLPGGLPGAEHLRTPPCSSICSRPRPSAAPGGPPSAPLPPWSWPITTSSAVRWSPATPAPRTPWAMPIGIRPWWWMRPTSSSPAKAPAPPCYLAWPPWRPCKATP